MDDTPDRIKALANSEALSCLRQINRGIEKESLRVNAQGNLAQSPHPAALGSALTHSSITTDYSEALLEFITPVRNTLEHSITDLEDIHSFVYQQLGDEMLWCTSMPCIVAGDDSIPVAHYGTSNVARMKTVYRLGLGHRYGRLMQAIAGVHYNWSMPAQYWAWEQQQAQDARPAQDYITERYLGLIRNFRRWSWLLIYLFGASPAVCASFLKGRQDHQLEPFDEQGRSLYLPHGTALRMGDLGYNSNAQKNLNICYNSLPNYIDRLVSAILQPHADYQRIPSGEGGDFQQLNASLLQIENEFYSPIRPKRVARSGETALTALMRGGIEYIEVRCVDVSPFHPVGIDLEQMRFLDAFLLFCLLQDSPPCDDNEQAQVARNLEAVVNRGRQPDLVLEQKSKSSTLQAWAEELLQGIAPISQLFDKALGSTDYTASFSAQQARVKDPELTPSARILREMREQDVPFFRLAMSYSENWAEYFRTRKLNPDVHSAFDRETQNSLAAQQRMEAESAPPFADYLANYYDQYRQLSG